MSACTCRSWLTLLAQPGLVLRQKGGSDRYCFSMGPLGMRSFIAWPAVQKRTPMGLLLYPDLQ
eukprot:3108651-Amphidinium_carterae.1